MRLTEYSIDELIEMDKKENPEYWKKKVRQNETTQ